MSNSTTTEHNVSIQTVAIIQGQECNVIVQGKTANDVRTELAFLLAKEVALDTEPKVKEEAPKKPVEVAPEEPSQPEEKTEAPTVEPEPAEAKPEEDATPSAESTATTETQVEPVSAAQLLEAAKALLATEGGGEKLKELLTKHEAARVTTVPAEKRDALFADINAATGA